MHFREENSNIYGDHEVALSLNSIANKGSVETCCEVVIISESTSELWTSYEQLSEEFLEL